jgi:ligand-binding SRPBCC domain-containing protein
MKIYTLRRQQSIRKPPAELFRFFERPENLELITPSSVGFTILTPQPISLKPGTVLDYTIRLLGLPVRWTTLISSYDPPHSFTDVAIRGPYRFWHHTHRFEPTDRGTLMTDEVRYAMPVGPIGRLVHTLWVRRKLKYIFDYRARKISELLENPNQKSSQPPSSHSANRVKEQ